MIYLIWERETAPTTHRHHIQGYVRFKTRRRINAVKELLHSAELHLEEARGTEQSNKDYCSKERPEDGDWAEEGTFKPISQGHRSDLDDVADDILKGLPLSAVATSHPASWMRYHAGIVSFSRQVGPAPPLRRDITVKILWGPSGVGKTHRVLSKYPDTVTISSGRDPFGNYTNEDVIVFDEFDWINWKIQDMNRYLDVWRCKLDCRYADKHAVWSKVFILANTDPSHWYSWIEEPLRAAFFRRINEIIYIENKEQIILI